MGAADLAVELGAEKDGHLLAFVEPDPAAEEGHEADTRAEAERLRALQEEHPLFREKERKASQVDPPLIDLGFGKVHVVAGDADKVGREVLVDVEPAVKRIVPPGRSGGTAGRADETVGLAGNPFALTAALDPGGGTGLHRVIEIAVPVCPGKSDRLQLSRDDPLDVDPPDREPRLKRNRLERNPQLRAPAVLQNTASGFPDPIPVETRGPAVSQPFAARTKGGDIKEVSLSFVLKGVDEDSNVVIARSVRASVMKAHAHPASPRCRGTVVGHGVGGDSARLAVQAQDAYVKASFVVEDPELGPLSRFGIGLGLDHPELAEWDRRPPHRVGEEAVDLRTLVDRDGPDPGSQCRGGT